MGAKVHFKSRRGGFRGRNPRRIARRLPDPSYSASPRGIGKIVR